MRKITALAFAWWYYCEYEKLKNFSDSDLLILWNEQWKHKTIQKIFKLVDDEKSIKEGDGKNTQLSLWSLFPLFLITASKNREYFFREIFTTLKIHPIGVIEIDIVCILFDHTEYGYNEEQKIRNCQLLNDLDYSKLRMASAVLKVNDWPLFDYDWERISNLSIETDIWCHRGMNQIFLPENEDDMKFLASFSCVIAGHPSLLQVY